MEKWGKMGHILVHPHFPHFSWESRGTVIKKLVSKYPVEKWGGNEVSGGIREIGYRANSKVSQNPKFCVGCFEVIISKNFAAASKMGKNGQKNFLRSFLRNPFLRRVLDQKLIFFAVFFLRFGD